MMKQLTRDFGKIIAVIGIFILVTDICGCNAHANEYQKFYLLNNELYDEDNYALSDTALVAKVLPNKIEFYQNTSSTNYQWASIPQMDFELHGKYDYLFCGDLDGICIMIVNKGIISIYLFDGTIGGWDKEANYTFNLPSDYEDVIFFESYMGIVSNRQIKFYDFDVNGQFTEITEMLFELPVGYSNVISNGSFYISFIQNNKLHSFEYEPNGWSEITFLSFLIPAGSKAIITRNDGIPHIGVVFDSFIQFYDFSFTTAKWMTGVPIQDGKITFSNTPVFEFESNVSSNPPKNNEVTFELGQIRYSLIPCVKSKAVSTLEFFGKIKKFYYLDVYNFTFNETIASSRIFKGELSDIRKIYSGYSYGTIEIGYNQINVIMYANLNTGRYTTMQFADFNLGGGNVSDANLKQMFEEAIMYVDNK